MVMLGHVFQSLVCVSTHHQLSRRLASCLSGRIRGKGPLLCVCVCVCRCAIVHVMQCTSTYLKTVLGDSADDKHN